MGLEHSGFNSHITACSNPAPVRGKVAQFHRRCQQIRVAFRFAASLGLSEEKLKQIEEEFEAIDEDGDGEVRTRLCVPCVTAAGLVDGSFVTVDCSGVQCARSGSWFAIAMAFWLAGQR